MGRSDVVFIACVLGFVVGYILSAWLSSFSDNRHSIAKSLIADCAVQEKPELRNTTGVATYNVSFKDGDWVSCLREATALAESASRAFKSIFLSLARRAYTCFGQQ